eukprot:gnl/Chilomastix_caulleri/1326.p1 GENE.gnl/Chilomastix_caulleri/1326~~gnl/Chilomastix_caulleri/1326.p1  ORF type:complete len:137 (+),score=11.89 gnl/Chilomastix_caulleri/1326:221-631(+)
MCQALDYYVIYCGLILILLLDGVLMIEVCLTLFGPPQIEAFLTANGFDLVTRAHQVVMAGYEFFSRRRLVTLFSAPNYCGEYGNNGAVMSIDQTLMCSFQIIQARCNDRTNTPSSALWEGSKPGTPPREFTRRGLY